MPAGYAKRVVAILLVGLVLATFAQNPSLIPSEFLGRETYSSAWSLFDRLARSVVQIGLSTINFLGGKVEKVLDPNDPPTTVSGYAQVAWDHDPITVSITLGDGVDSRNLVIVRAAISDWQSKLRTRLNFPSSYPADRSPFGIKFVNDNRADVTIYLMKQASGQALGVTSVTYSGSIIRKARLEISVNSPLGLPLDTADIYNVAAHEFGHALGLPHSTGKTDLMYPSYDFMRVNYRISPSTCDVEMLILLYRPDGFAAPNSPSALSGFTCPSSGG